MKKDILDGNNGMVPVVVVDKSINDRMASTVRHNRARGEHAIKGMAEIVFSMLENGWSNSEVCNELGMEVEELKKNQTHNGVLKTVRRP